MDSLTQIVLGGAVGELVAGKKLGNRAVLWGAVAGTIPDLDVFLRAFYHPIEAALVHRGFSHSLLFAVLVSPILGWIFNRISKSHHGFWLWTHLFFWGIVTHPILDMFTNYGTQFFWPLDARITFNSVFVIDPLYTLPFMGLLIWAMRLDRSSKKRRGVNAVGLIYSTSYLLLGLLIKWYVWNNTVSYMKEHHPEVKRIMVTPMPFTSFYWYILAETDNEFIVAYRSIFNREMDEKPRVINRGALRIDSLRWQGRSQNQNLHLVTNDYCWLKNRGDTLWAYDLRFGFTGKFTDMRIDQPLMGYQMVLRNELIVGSKSFRGVDWEAVDFKTYLKYVLGLR
jgi:inner membrane protein